MLRRWSLFWLVAVLAAGRLSAGLTITYLGADVWRVQWTAHSGGQSWNSVYVSNPGDTAPYQTLVSGSSWSAGESTFTITEANPTRYVHWNLQAPNYSLHGPYTYTGEVTYGITVNLPANGTSTTKHYFAKQGSETVGTTFQLAGAGARQWYIGNLQSDDPVSVHEVTGGTIDVDTENPDNWGPNPSTESTSVSIGSPSTESSPGAGAGAETDVTGGGTAPAPSNPPTAPPDAPTPTANPTAPTSTTIPSAPTAVTPFSPSGGDPVTKADAEAVANKQLEATDKVAQAVHAGAAAGVAATDKVASAVWEAGKKATEATDKVSTSVWESGKKQIEATDKVTAAVDKSRGELSGKMSQMIEKQNSMLGAQNTTNSKLDEIKEALEATDAKEAAQTAADAAVASAATSSAAAVTGITGALPGSVGSLPYSPDVSGGSADFLSVSMPDSFGGATVNFNPFANAGMAAIASWFRSATAWLCYLLLGQFVFGQLRAALDTVATARQASGNPVFGGTGGQATAAVNAGLLTAAALVAVSALAAWAFEGINIAGLVSNVSASPLVGMSSNVFWFLDQFLPCATIITCAVARAAWHLYSGPVIATYITVCRWFIA